MYPNCLEWFDYCHVELSGSATFSSFIVSKSTTVVVMKQLFEVNLIL